MLHRLIFSSKCVSEVLRRTELYEITFDSTIYRQINNNYEMNYCLILTITTHRRRFQNCGYQPFLWYILHIVDIV